MTTEQKPRTKFTRSATFKGMMIAVITLLMLIPAFMVEGLIMERKWTRDEAIQKIDAKWSYAQTVSGPVLVVPYTTTTVDNDKKVVTLRHMLNITPEKLDIRANLVPEVRYYGIYKTILYKSTITISGNFLSLDKENFPSGKIDWEGAYIKFGVSDLRGISDDIAFEMYGKTYKAHATGEKDILINEILKVNIEEIALNEAMAFNCVLSLKGSGSINFLPIGRTTDVTVSGAWPDPGFIGNYSPEHNIDDDGFEATWKVLSFNRSIPDTWSGNSPKTSREVSFGVSLVETVDIYQQNMRSAKYALMFIALTFVIFFFVEVISRKRIHPVQYILVGVALILFYSLLLSISEPLGFRLAYLISSVATISLITVYASTIFRNRKQTGALAFVLSCLYIFLYVILQLEDMALLAGSVGLFVILGIIMYFSRKINWYNEES